MNEEELVSLYKMRGEFARALLLTAWVALSACTTVPAPASLTGPAEPGFSHSEFDSFLSRHVSPQGRVDYAAARHDRDDLDRYLARLAAFSPDNAPERFPAEDDRLAYWINAYNASAISLVLANMPIESVEDVPRPAAFFFLPRAAGFFVFQRVVLGEKKVSLYSLENGLIRKRFLEPRVHFALNCASNSCPRLPAQAFSAELLDAELEREARRFIGEARNVRLDPATGTGTLHLSSIFDWYEKDFTRWVADRRPELEASLRAYVTLYLAEDTAAAVHDCTDCAVEFIPYDWGLNAR
jgi:hypothetical protein